MILQSQLLNLKLNQIPIFRLRFTIDINTLLFLFFNYRMVNMHKSAEHNGHPWIYVKLCAADMFNDCTR